MEPVLQCIDLGRQEDGEWRLRGLEFSLHRGEAMGLLGPNGAGKSTALALVSGALAPSTGFLRFWGRPLDLAGRFHLGYLPQSPPLYPELTVAENLEFAGRLRGMRAAAVRARLPELQQLCDLQQLWRRLAGKLSRGEAQRVGLAQALIHQPDLLILDEPSAGLDALQAESLRQLLRGLRDRHAILIASHLAEDLNGLCQRLLLLDQGRQQGEFDLEGERGSARVRFDRPLQDFTALHGFDWISAVQPLADGWLRLTTRQAPTDAAQQLASLGWGLQAYLPQAVDLAGLLAGSASRSTS